LSTEGGEWNQRPTKVGMGANVEVTRGGADVPCRVEGRQEWRFFALGNAPSARGLRPQAILGRLGHGKACFEVSDGGEDGGKRTVGILSWRQDWIWTARVGAATWMTRRPQGCQSRRVEWSGSGLLLLVEGGRSTPWLFGEDGGGPCWGAIVRVCRSQGAR
jgi:hypothetical protein